MKPLNGNFQINYAIYKLYTIFIELKFPFMSMLPNDYKS